MEQVPAPNFGFSRPVRWLRLGDLQLHLYPVERMPERTNQHFGFEVDDFEAAYLKLRDLGAFSSSGDNRVEAAVWVIPGGSLQMYFRDPMGNLVEIDHPSADGIDLAVFGDHLKVLADEIPQSEENLRARLFPREREPVS